MEGIRRWFRLSDVERDVDEEIRLYFDEAVRELEAGGLSPAASREEAQRRFGDLRAYRRELLTLDRRADSSLRWHARLESARDTVRHAARSVVRAPALTLGIVLAFALGIGANATMYATVERLLLRAPAHIQEPDGVRRLLVQRDNGYGVEVFASTITYPDFEDFARTSGFSHVAAMNRREVTIGSGAVAQRVRAVFVNASWWELLGVTPVLGRFFTADEDRFGGARVAVLSHRRWQSAYGGNTNVLGQTIDFGYGPFTIIGVAPKGFTGVDVAAVDFFAPFLVAGELMQGGTEWAQERGWYWFSSIARLRPGVSIEAAEGEATAHHRAGRAEVESYDRNARVVAAPLLVARGPEAPSEVAVARWLLGVAVVVLLIACLNVANLLLARLIRQRREISIRLALGISRRRLIGQIFVEGMLLGAIGGVVALLLTLWGGAYVQRTLLPDVDWEGSLTTTVMLAIALLSILAGALSAIVPAVQAARRHVAEGLRTASGGITRSTAHVRATLSTVQAALSVVLLVGAGLFVRSLDNVRHGDFGIDPWNVIYFAPSFYSSATLEAEDRYTYADEALARVQRIPGVEAASVIAGVPFWSAYAYSLRVPGIDSIPRTSRGGPIMSTVSPDYFRAMRLDLRRGRVFDERDGRTAPPVVVLSESFASALWPGENPVGRCMYIGDGDVPCVEVIGTVEDASHGNLIEDVNFQYYLAAGQRVTNRRPEGLMVRAAGDIQPVMAAVQRAMLDVDSRVRFVRTVPMEDMVAPELRKWELGATMFSLFGLLALLVAAIGLYSVLAFDVAQRVREIGLRNALGASTRSIVVLVMNRAVRITVAGVALGGAAALLFAPRLQEMLYGVDARDPWTFAGVALVLGVISLIASGVPALRAARVDPNVALKAE